MKGHSQIQELILFQFERFSKLGLVNETRKKINPSESIHELDS